MHVLICQVLVCQKSKNANFNLQFDVSQNAYFDFQSLDYQNMYFGLIDGTGLSNILKCIFWFSKTWKSKYAFWDTSNCKLKFVVLDFWWTKTRKSKYAFWDIWQASASQLFQNAYFDFQVLVSQKSKTAYFDLSFCMHLGCLGLRNFNVCRIDSSRWRKSRGVYGEKGNLGVGWSYWSCLR